jgi:hypothetical protein
LGLWQTFSLDQPIESRELNDSAQESAHGIQIFELNRLTKSIQLRKPFENDSRSRWGIRIFADFRFFSNRGCSWIVDDRKKNRK